jgi:hypothetical protein
MTDEEKDIHNGQDDADEVDNDNEDDNEEGEEDEDEEEFWGCALPKPESGWALVATSFDGAESWEPKWKAIEDAARALSLLEELRDHEPDWNTLLAGLKHLHVLKDPDIRWPPLHDFRDFMSIGDFFLSFEGSNDWGVGSAVYILDVDDASLNSLMLEFEELNRRLRAYPPLQPYVRYM